jgi:plastocyanin
VRRLITISAMMIALAVAGCTSTATPPVETNQVEMPKSYMFSPTAISIKAGTTVTWHNGDNFSHSVHFTEGPKTSLNLAPGESGTLTFDTPGEYDYFCIYHAQQMNAKVIVSAK